MLPTLAHPERVAAPSIRGYLFQTVGIALRWLSLPADELLLCEGDEDAEHYILDQNGEVTDVTQVQFKDIEGSLSVRNEQVRESIFNFVRAYKHHQVQGRSIRFVFTTSARRARQRVDAESEHVSQAQSLAIDVLKVWMEIEDHENPTEAERHLVAALKSVVASAKPEGNSEGKPTKAEGDYAELEAAIEYLDEEPERWTSFLAAVDWQFERGRAAATMVELEEALADDARTREMPTALFAQRLVVKVLETSADGDTSLRLLDRPTLDGLARLSRQQLEDWAKRTSAGRLQAWMEEVIQRVADLETLTTAHSEKLDRQDARLKRREEAALEALKRQSERNLRYLSEFGALRIGSTAVRVHRAVVAALADAASDQSLVVVGDPGAGKSGALADVANELKGRGCDVVALTAEAAYSLGDDLIDVLEMWQGDGAGVLLVDALDSVRDDEKAAALRKTLGDVVRSGGRWRVVATIRTFDLFQGTSIAKLFAGTPPTTFSDVRFPSVRHVWVGELCDEEMNQLESTAPQLYDMASNAPADLRTLLRIPFHLSLAASLLDAGLAPDTIASVRTRTELLELYWRHRVADHAASKDAREALLRAVCGEMIEHRSLQVSKTGLDATRLYDLLTANVLREPPSSTEAHDDDLVAFAHHVLFDYAVAKLWVPRDAAALAERLAEDPQLVIVVRPSLEMAMQRWWADDETRKSGIL